MTLNEFKKISGPLQKDLEAALLKYGFTMGKRTASINSDEGTVRYTMQLVDANLKDASGNATTPEAKRFAQYASIHGLAPTDIGRSFTMNGKAFEVVGLRDGRSEKSVLVKRGDTQKTYVMRPDDVRGQLAIAAMRAADATKAETKAYGRKENA